MILPRKPNRKPRIEPLVWGCVSQGPIRCHTSIKEWCVVSYSFISWVLAEFTFVSKFRFIFPLCQKDKDCDCFHPVGEFRVLLMFSKLCLVFSKLIAKIIAQKWYFLNSKWFLLLFIIFSQVENILHFNFNKHKMQWNISLHWALMLHLLHILLPLTWAD